MKYTSYWTDRKSLDISPSDGPFGAEVPESLLTQLEIARKVVWAIEDQIHDLTEAPRLAEEQRRAALTPKQRRDEDYAKAIAILSGRLNG